MRLGEIVYAFLGHYVAQNLKSTWSRPRKFDCDYSAQLYLRVIQVPVLNIEITG